MSLRVMPLDPAEVPLTMRPSWPEHAIEAVLITDADLAVWRKVPEAWQGNVPLCDAVLVYFADEPQFAQRVACRERAVWQNGARGLCGGCMARHLDVGQ